VRRKTELEALPKMPPRVPTVDEGIDPNPRGGGALPSAARRVTIFDPGAVARSGAQNTPSTRKVVGVLVTYTWSDQGQIFPVLEGRNRIGSDPSQCDISIPQDDTLSAINSHILFRKNFTIGDDVSMGGTDVDDDPVEAAFVPLRNYARIRTGSTHWVFIAIQPPGDENSDTRPEG
jgi:hypothetical protein